MTSFAFTFAHSMPDRASALFRTGFVDGRKSMSLGGIPNYQSKHYAHEATARNRRWADWQVEIYWLGYLQGRLLAHVGADVRESA